MVGRAGGKGLVEVRGGLVVGPERVSLDFPVVLDLVDDQLRVAADLDALAPQPPRLLHARDQAEVLGLVVGLGAHIPAHP